MISIISCPKCHTFLLSDTGQCHRCRHVIDAAQAAQFRDASLPSDAGIEPEERCRQCGETYRKGLVRCWSCGAFTRPDIEDAYYRLLQGHAHHVNAAGQHYELPEISAEEIRRQYRVEDEQKPAAEVFPAIDEDFELTGNLRLLEDQPAAESAAPIPLIPAAGDAAKASPAPAEAPAAQQSDATASAMKQTDATAPPVDETDSLLSHAKAEETAAQKSRRARLGEGFVIYCPMGCKIRVQERHRGKIGRCPKCQSTFVVPMASQTSLAGAVPASAAENAQPATSGKFNVWMEDVHLHKVAPQKLRIKPDSLLKDFQPVDVGFDSSGMALAGLPAAPTGLFAAKNPKKTETARAAVRDHLRTADSLDGVEAPFKQMFTPEQVQQFAIAQPTPPDTDSLFGDIPVFGTARVAVRLPKFDDKTTSYLSFSLSEFREFSRHLAEVFGIESFGAGCGIPLTDEYRTDACFVAKRAVKELQNLAWYQKDPAIKLEVSGYRCKTCATVISEVARAAQKLGGPEGKAIAKAKCPKCNKPLGHQPLYVVPAPAVEAARDEQPSAAEPAESTTEPTAATAS